MYGWRVLLWVLLVAVAAYFLYLVRSVAIPFALAFLFAAVLDPAVRRLAKKGLKWRSAVVVVWLGVMTAFSLLVIWLAPIATKQIVMFRDKTEGFAQRVSQQTEQDSVFSRWNPRYVVATDPLIRQIDQFFESNESNLKRVGFPTSRRLAMSQYVEPFRQQTVGGMEQFSRGVLNVLATIGSNAFLYAFVPLIVLFILLDLERFKERAAALVPPSIRGETVEIVSDVFGVFFGYLRGMSITLMYYVVISALTLTILGAPYSLLLAFVFMAIYLLPMIGGVINVVVLFALTGASGRTGNFFMHFESSWTYALVVAIVYAIVFTLFDPLITTRVVGNAVGLSPVLSFFVVFSFGALFGPIGMVFAFPLAGAAKVILDRLLEVTSKSQDLHLPPLPMRHRPT